MAGKLKPIALRVCVAVALIALLVQIAGVELSQFANVSLHHVALTLLLSVLTLLLRAMNFRLISGQHARSDFAGWMSLTANHQVLFSAIPSGLGDLSFPHLARSKTGLPLAHGARLIAIARARDALSLLALATFGLAIEGRAPDSIFLLSGIFLAISFQLEPCAQLLLRVLPTNGKLADRLSALTRSSGRDVHWSSRLTRTGGSLAIWLSASAAVGAAFGSAGAQLAAGDVLILIAGLNVVGLLAVSVAGIGIAEAGAAGILIWLGWAAEPAAITALIGRPVLLICVLSASGLVAVAARMTTYKWRGAATAQLASSTPET